MIIALQYHYGFSYIIMNLPRVYMCPPILNPLPSPSLLYPSELTQSAGFGCPSPSIELTLVICFTYDNVHISVLDLMAAGEWGRTSAVKAVHKEGEKKTYHSY